MMPAWPPTTALAPSSSPTWSYVGPSHGWARDSIHNDIDPDSWPTLPPPFSPPCKAYTCFRRTRARRLRSRRLEPPPSSGHPTSSLPTPWTAPPLRPLSLRHSPINPTASTSRDLMAKLRLLPAPSRPSLRLTRTAAPSPRWACASGLCTTSFVPLNLLMSTRPSTWPPACLTSIMSSFKNPVTKGAWPTCWMSSDFACAI